MSEKMVELGKLCLFITDGDHMPPPKADDGIPFITISNIIDNGIDFGNCLHVSPEYWEQLDEKRKAKNGDILLTVTGSYGIPVYVDFEKKFVFQRHIAIIRPNPQKLDGQFLYCWLKFSLTQEYMRKHVTGAVQKTLGLDAIRKMPILDIPILEQKKLVGILTSVDSKINNNRSICSDLEAMAKLLYDYWFIQFDFPDENGKPYKSSGGKMVWNEELKREIPEGWKVDCFGSCIESINTGLNPRQNFKLNIGGRIKYLTVKNLTKDGTIDFAGCDYIDEQARSIVHKRSGIQIGDILFASIAPLGRCHIILEQPENWDINESVFAIRPCADMVTSAFLYMTFTSEAFVKKAESSSTGSVFKGIRNEMLRSMLTIVPPKGVLDDWDKKVKKLFELKEKCAAENRELASLRDFLLPMLMNGQVTVGKAE